MSVSKRPVATHLAPEPSALAGLRHKTVWLRGHISPAQPLANLLQYLVANEEQGCLLVLHPIERQGVLYFAARQVVHCALPQREGEAALRQMLGWQQGDFRGFRQTPSPKQSVKRALSNILLEFDRDCSSVLQPQSQLKCNQAALKQAGKAIQLSPQEVTLLRQLESWSSLTTLTTLLRLEPKQVQRIAERLLARGLIVMQDPQDTSFPPAFLNGLQILCARFIGPMAQLALQDGLEYLAVREQRIAKAQRHRLGKLLLQHVPVHSRAAFREAYRALVAQYL